MIVNPLVQAARAKEMQQQQIARLLHAGAHLNPTPLGMPNLGAAPYVAGIPQRPQVQPPAVPPPKALTPQMPMQPKVAGDPLQPHTLTPDQLQTQANQYGAMARQLLQQPDPPQPTYEAPQHPQQDPRAILIAGLGSALFRGAAGPVAAGLEQRDELNQKQYESNVQQSENAYNRQMAAYDRTIGARESRMQHLLTAQEDAGKESETMRDHLAHEAAVQQQLKLRGMEIANKQSDLAARLKEKIWETAGKLGVQKDNIAEHYWAVSTQQAGALQRMGMRDDTAINVAQLAATSRLVDRVISGQNSYRNEQLVQSGQWDRAQLIQENLNARGAMGNLNKLLIAATNPKNPNARAAVAALQSAMDDPSSPISQMMESLQQSGVMGAPLGDEFRAEIDAETTATPQAGVTVNVQPAQQPGYVAEPGAQAPQGPLSLDDVQQYLKQLHVGGGGGGAAAVTPPVVKHPAQASVTPQDLESARGWLQFFMQGKPMSPATAHAAWEQFVADPRTHAHTMNPHELEHIKAQLLGTGGPEPKNAFPSLP